MDHPEANTYSMLIVALLETGEPMTRPLGSNAEGRSASIGSEKGTHMNSAMTRLTSSTTSDDDVVSPAISAGWLWPAAALLLMALPFVCFVTPQISWSWAAPLFGLAGLTLGRMLPQWRGHALIWAFFGVALAVRVPWPLSLILPSVLVPALQRFLPSLKPITKALRWGQLDAGTLVLASAIVVVSSSALIGWFVWGGADVSDIVAMMPRVPLALLLVGILLFSIANALWEELLMKWLVWDGVERLLRGRFFVVAFQAALFGLLHYHGFPRGWLGVTLAAGYGLLLGLLRVRSGGILALVVTHVFADIVICLLIVSKLPH